MNPNTGDLYENMTDDELKAIERKLNQRLTMIPAQDVERVRSMSKDERKAYAKRVERNRRKRKARKGRRR